MQKVASVNSTTNTFRKKPMLREDRQSLLSSPFMTSGQEMKQVYSFNPGARTRPYNICKTPEKNNKPILQPFSTISE